MPKTTAKTNSKPKPKKRRVQTWKVAPLSSGFMLTGIIGFFISALKIYPLSKTWGFTFMIFFAIIVIAAVYSMTYADTDALLQIDHARKP